MVTGGTVHGSVIPACMSHHITHAMRFTDFRLAP